MKEHRNHQENFSLRDTQPTVRRGGGRKNTGNMLRRGVSHGVPVLFKRFQSGKPSVPFDLDLGSGKDDEYSEINNFYSDMFTGSSRESLDGEPVEDDIAQINAEMDELYGIKSNGEAVARDLLGHVASNEPKVVISTMTNPFRNLALEEFVFANTPRTPQFNAQRLVLYTNSPCVVVGKNQNPWKEVNLPLIHSLSIPMLRRRSGGGTVVHDLHNVNYSYMTTRESFDRKFFGGVIVSQLQSIGVALKQNERGDIITMEGLKVSGSAYKISKGLSYHHGTMLLSSKLDILKKLLDTTKRDRDVTIRCNGVDSVPAPVTNVGIDNDVFVEQVVTGFKQLFNQEVDVITVGDESPLQPDILTISEELQEWDWKYGNSPKFEYDIRHPDFEVTFNVEKGYLQHFTVKGDASQFNLLSMALDNGERLQFRGDVIAGYIVDDTTSQYIGERIDGTD